MSKIVIYGLKCKCHPEGGIRYVGQTKKGMTARLYVHLWNARNRESKNYGAYVYNWIRKHGEENIIYDVLEECLEEELDNREKEWIDRLREEGAKLTNIRPGGASLRGYKNPKQSENMKGERNPMYGKDRRELLSYVRSFQGPMSEENKQKMSKRVRGEGNPTAKLTEDDIRDIRGRGQYYGINADLSREFGVSANNISQIRARKIWTHVED